MRGRRQDQCVLVLTLLIVLCVGDSGQVRAQEGSKDIKSVEVVKRPIGSTGGRSDVTYSSSKPFTKVLPGPNTEYSQLGITIWRLRKAGGAKALEEVGLESEATLFEGEQVEAGTPMGIGSLVRFGIEPLTHDGFLYVIDREQFADGTYGAAYLFFPTLGTRNGNNNVRAHELILVPNLPNYFRITPNVTGKTQTAEVLTFILSSTPLQLPAPLGKGAMRLSDELFKGWERQWSVPVNTLEMNGGAGLATSVNARAQQLTTDDPLPQTIYRAAISRGEALMVTEPLRFPAPHPMDASGIADYRAMLNNFLTDAKATKIRFGYEQLGDSPAVFQLSNRTLIPGVPADNELRPPRIEAPGISITDWKGTYIPRLNGTPLRLDTYETSRSLAIAPDAERFLLGTEHYVRLFNRSGQEIWNVHAPGVAWGVNISGDGRYALAAYGDGTIRWYDLTDGKELLAFFPHKDRKRWVLWTPSGYYDASPGAEDLIGWSVDNGGDRAIDSNRIGQFRSTYYRPDVIARVLQIGDEKRAVALANEEAGREPEKVDVARKLPPVVEIISPGDITTISTTEVTVRFRVRTPSGEPVTNVRALVDGRPASATKDLVQRGAEADTRELRITVPEHNSEVSIIAENRFAPSVPATVRLRWQRRLPHLDSLGEVAIRPRLFILAVGVSHYANENYNLQFADKDASDFVRAMMAQKGLQYREVVIYHDQAITNESATKEEIEDGLDWIRNQTTSDDVAMVFFSGHGVNDRSNYYFFCPYNINVTALLRTGVPFSDIKNAISSVKGKVLFFVDSCHSGNSLGLAGRRDINGLINDLSSAPNGVVVISATTSSELAYERAEWKNGAFTKAVVEGMNGAANFRDGRVTYAGLFDYVADRVETLTESQQHPALGAQAVPRFPIALRR